jgi:hypothetical protein
MTFLGWASQSVDMTQETEEKRSLDIWSVRAFTPIYSYLPKPLTYKDSFEGLYKNANVLIAFRHKYLSFIYIFMLLCYVCVYIYCHVIICIPEEIFTITVVIQKIHTPLRNLFSFTVLLLIEVNSSLLRYNENEHPQFGFR